MNKVIEVSNLGHTWMFDLDGTLVKHNGYKLDGHDTLLKGVKEFFSQIPTTDFIIIVTSRTEEFRKITEKFLYEEGLRYNHIIFGAPMGERLIFNDEKPGGLKTAMAFNLKRDDIFEYKIEVNEEL